MAKAEREAAPWLSAVWQLTGATMVGAGMGYGVDRYFGSEPWGLLVGGLVGVGTGFYAFLRSVTRLLEAQSKTKSQSQSKSRSGPRGSE